MLLGSLIDAGVSLDKIQKVLDDLIPNSVRFSQATVNRGGQRSVKITVERLAEDPPHRSWASIRKLLSESTIPEATREMALKVFARLAEAEGHVHGVSPDEVHFHEVGALDSIADVVGVCEGLRLLDVSEVSASEVALGSGRILAAHGDIPVPAPAVAQLALGWPSSAGPSGEGWHSHDGHSHDHSHDEHESHEHTHSHGSHTHSHGSHTHSHHHDLPHDEPAPVTTPGAVGELATPTGLAVIRALAECCEKLPLMTTSAIGIGAGGKDFAGHPNVVRVLIGETFQAAQSEQVTELAANVDDQNPQLWPGIMDALFDAGALDAWLTPILMKKGRPAHTVHALCRPADAEAISDVLLSQTSTLGVRFNQPERFVLDRSWHDVEVDGQEISVKVASRAGQILHATSEFESLAEAARKSGKTQAEMAQLAQASIVEAGLVAGNPVPESK